MPDTHSGTCFCGSIVIEVTGVPLEMGYCHCGSCRSYTGSPLAALALWRDEQVTVSQGAELLGGFAKTPMSHRRFCTRCGGHIMTEHPGTGFTDIYAAVLPTLPFRPVVHLNYAETIFPVMDGLPKFRDFPAHAGGSDELVPE